ncbi:MAG: site-specific DNA-methyltransferase [Victivallales bacterium]|nr:site-specific DNA-methyltransferase [Victivallales bacterium]
MDKRALAQKIKALDGLSNDEKSALLELLHERKKYGIVWEDKPEDVETQLKDELPVLTEVKERAILSEDADAPNHILIEGDNLHALTALSYTHAGRIDVIYIDPPYNTGKKNDFKYNDDWVDKEDSYRHSKWLSFMRKRLEITKELLSEKGVIFISIDDNEQAQLKLLCNEVFGEKNYIATICRQAIKGGSRSDNIRTVHDYVHIFAKSIEIMQKFTGYEKDELDLELTDNKGAYTKGRELNKWGAGSRREDSPTMWFAIPGPNGEDVYPIRNDGSDGRWRWGKKKMLKAVSEDEVIFEKRENGTYIVYEKVRGLKNKNKQFTTWFADNYVNSRGSEALKRIYGTLMSVFDFAKPVELIYDICFMSNCPNGIILDFFAGSGTTLQATMQLNADDGGHRQCILITNNENNICEEITYDRNRRVIQGYTIPKGEAVEGLHSNNLRYYKTTFVPRVKTMANKRALTVAATDLLCIKNNVYQEIGEFGGVKLHPKVARYFDDGKTRMLVIYIEAAISKFVDLLLDMEVEGKILVYVFSNDNYAYDDDFEEVMDKVELCALPDAIYKAYKNVLPQNKTAEDVEGQNESEAANSSEEDAQ